MDNDIIQKVQTCKVCQLTQNKSKCKFKSWPESSGPWQRVHIDLLDTHKAKMFILIDDYSKWVEFFIVNNTNLNSITNKLNDCFSRFSVPCIIVSDNGPPFNSYQFKSYCEDRGIKLMQIAPYNPRSNGLAEREVQSVKKLLVKSVLSNNSISLETRLNQCLFSLRSTPSSVTGVSPMSIMLNFKAKTPISMSNPDFSHCRSSLKDQTKQSLKKKVSFDLNNEKEFVLGEKVLVNLSYKKGPVKWFPATVIKKLGNVMYIVKLNMSGESKKVHVSQLKTSRLDDKDHENDVLLYWPVVDNEQSNDVINDNVNVR